MSQQETNTQESNPTTALHGQANKASLQKPAKKKTKIRQRTVIFAFFHAFILLVLVSIGMRMDGLFDLYKVFLSSDVIAQENMAEDAIAAEGITPLPPTNAQAQRNAAAVAQQQTDDESDETQGQGGENNSQNAAAEATEFADIVGSIETDNTRTPGARRALIERARRIEERLALLHMTERRIDEKVKSLTALRGELEALVNQADAMADTDVENLVKVYESMRASDAAVIFNGLDIDVLIAVFERMGEKKSAPILGAMDPERAREVTELLVNRQPTIVNAAKELDQ
ncbi:MAG: hypothetical protein AAF442_08995 [Pseudomonadota bacterium]